MGQVVVKPMYTVYTWFIRNATFLVAFLPRTVLGLVSRQFFEEMMEQIEGDDARMIWANTAADAYKLLKRVLPRVAAAAWEILK